MSSAAPKSTTAKSGGQSSNPASGSPRQTRVAQDERQREKLRVAVHEAAHAVISIRTGGVARVVLHANDGQFSGETNERPGPRHTWRCPPAFRHALVNVAGAIAEAKFFGEAAPPAAFASDRANLARYAAKLGVANDAAEVWRADVHKRVECAFDDQRIWSAVLALAGYLFSAMPDDGSTEIDDTTLRAIVPWVAA